MLRGRPSLVRVVMVAAAGVSCLAVAACGTTTSSTAAAASSASTTSSASTVPSASSTADPLASLTAHKVVAEATANARAASSLKMAGTLNESGVTYILDLGVKRGHRCSGTIAERGKGSFKLIVIGKTVYFNPDNKFWETFAGADASAAIALVNGRYIETSTSKSLESFASMCDTTQLIGSNTITGSTRITKGTVTMLGGTRVLRLTDSAGGVMYVTDTSKPEVVEIAKAKNTGDGTGKVDFSVGAPVTVAAPPASQVIEGSKIGL
jgi:hypothetical protein